MVVDTRRWWRSACGWSMAMAIGASMSGAGALDLALPNKTDSLKFAVIGDFGTGDRPSYEIAAQMTALRARFPFEIVITTGDNILGRQNGPSDFADKFERPFGPLIRAGVRFYASLGNHDKPVDQQYPPWNLDGQRYHTYAKRNVRFFVLDTNRPDRTQIAWIEQALRGSREGWKICYFHHPLYSSAKQHGPALDLRVVLEPIFVRYGVDVVFTGHDHVYERLKPQKGIHHFVAGAGGQLRKGDIEPSAATAASFDQDRSFMLVEVSGDELYFQTVSRSGAIVDTGVIRRRPKE